MERKLFGNTTLLGKVPSTRKPYNDSANVSRDNWDNITNILDLAPWLSVTLGNRQS